MWTMWSCGLEHSNIHQVEPYIDDFNVPVLSQNGEKPVYYKGFHQTDVIRIKS